MSYRLSTTARLSPKSVLGHLQHQASLHPGMSHPVPAAHYLGAHCTFPLILFLMPADQVQDILFSQKGWQALGKYFRFLHFTSEQPEGLHRHVLRFGFNLPRLGHMEELDPLLTMVMLFIDAVGQHKLSPDQRKKGEERRQELEKQTTKVGNGQESRLEELRMKKAEEEKVSLGCGCMCSSCCCCNAVASAFYTQGDGVMRQTRTRSASPKAPSAGVQYTESGGSSIMHLIWSLAQ